MNDATIYEQEWEEKILFLILSQWGNISFHFRNRCYITCISQYRVDPNVYKPMVIFFHINTVLISTAYMQLVWVAIFVGLDIGYNNLIEVASTSCVRYAYDSITGADFIIDSIVRAKVVVYF